MNFFAMRQLLTGVLILVPGWMTITAQERSPFEVEETDQTVRITESGQPVLTYQRTATSRQGKHHRGHYLHPVWSLDHHVLTEDFPEDHRHHRGIFWAWHQVRVAGRKIGDPWECRDFVWDVASLAIDRSQSNSLTLTTHVEWKSGVFVDAEQSPGTIVREKTLIRIHRATASVRRIDFHIELLAAVDDVSLGGSEDPKGYGGFSVRARMPADLVFTAESRRLEPRITGIQAGSWVDLAANFGTPSGLTIVQHRTNPGFPDPWILRRKGSMQNSAYPGREPVKLSTEEPLRLSYSLLIHRGLAPPLPEIQEVLAPGCP